MTSPPSHHKRPRIFYGWVMLPVAMLATIATLPGQSVGISVFNEHLRNSLDLSHSELTGAYLLGTLLASLPALAVGKLMDRFGIRLTIWIVIFLLGAACLFMSQAGGLVTIFIAFLLLRLLGHGALPLLVDNSVAMWFRRRLGLVSGLEDDGHDIGGRLLAGLDALDDSHDRLAMELRRTRAAGVGSDVAVDIPFLSQSAGGYFSVARWRHVGRIKPGQNRSQWH